MTRVHCYIRSSLHLSREKDGMGQVINNIIISSGSGLTMLYIRSRLALFPTRYDDY